MDSIPIVAITGQVPRRVIGTDAFQEADITGITMPITKHNYLVQRRRGSAAHHRRRRSTSRATGRPGPVLVDIPRTSRRREIDFDYPEPVDLPGYKPTFKRPSAADPEGGRG